MSPIRVIIADDHGPYRRSLRRLCERLGPFEVVGEARGGLETVELARALRPDVVLMDVSMPGLDGLEATRRLVTREPCPAVVLLTMHVDPHYRQEAAAAGARAFLLKDEDYHTILEAIRAVHRGDDLLADLRPGPRR
jgi:DNA-binding NarL/FixJ family response regulator